MTLRLLILLRNINFERILVNKLKNGLLVLPIKKRPNPTIHPNIAPHFLQLIIQFLLNQKTIFHILTNHLNLNLILINILLNFLIIIINNIQFILYNSYLIHNLINLFLSWFYFVYFMVLLLFVLIELIS